MPPCSACSMRAMRSSASRVLQTTAVWSVSLPTLPGENEVTCPADHTVTSCMVACSTAPQHVRLEILRCMLWLLPCRIASNQAGPEVKSAMWPTKVSNFI